MKKENQMLKDSVNLVPTYTTNDLCNIFHCNKNQITMWRQYGLLKGLRTGKNYIYSRKEIECILDRFTGYDISNPVHVKEALNDLENNE